MSTVQAFLRVAEKLTPVLKNSKFKETGVLTPEEFVAAGDFITFRCGTWQWASGEESKRRPYLPPDKQFLITRNVPCYRRVKDMEYNDNGSANIVDDDGENWVTTHNAIDSCSKGGEEEIAEIMSSVQISNSKQDEEDNDNDEDIPELDDNFDTEDNLVEEEDPAALDDKGADSNILKTRTYDLSITYDKYYQTPRLWLFGYDEQGRPLPPEAIFQDISQDHAKKTVTMEPHPHLNVVQASIHPCRHSNVMKRIIDHLVDSGKDLRVDQYLILFLKFVSAIIPTVEYDYTISMDG